MGEAERVAREREAAEQREREAREISAERQQQQQRADAVATIRPLATEALALLRRAGWPDARTIVNSGWRGIVRQRAIAGWEIASIAIESSIINPPSWITPVHQPLYLLSDGQFVYRERRPNSAEDLVRMGLGDDVIAGLKRLIEQLGGG